MRSYSFSAYGHPNILSTHKNTLEITKDNYLTKKGDCIIGIRADFELKKLMEFIENSSLEQVRITLDVEGIHQYINGKLNKQFNDANSIVIRKSGYISDRTLVTYSDISSADLKRDFIKMLGNPDIILRITLT